MALASRFPELPVYARGKSTKSNIFPKVYDNKNKKMNYSGEHQKFISFILQFENANYLNTV